MTGRNGEAVEGMRHSDGRLGVGTDNPVARLDTGNAVGNRRRGRCRCGVCRRNEAPFVQGGVLAVCVNGEWEGLVRGDNDGQEVGRCR